MVEPVSAGFGSLGAGVGAVAPNENPKDGFALLVDSFLASGAAIGALVVDDEPNEKLDAPNEILASLLGSVG